MTIAEQQEQQQQQQQQQQMTKFLTKWCSDQQRSPSRHHHYYLSVVLSLYRLYPSIFLSFCVFSLYFSFYLRPTVIVANKKTRKKWQFLSKEKKKKRKAAMRQAGRPHIYNHTRAPSSDIHTTRTYTPTKISKNSPNNKSCALHKYAHSPTSSDTHSVLSPTQQNTSSAPIYTAGVHAMTTVKLLLLLLLSLLLLLL